MPSPKPIGSGASALHLGLPTAFDNLVFDLSPVLITTPQEPVF